MAANYSPPSLHHVTIVNHPLVKQQLAQLRHHDTPPRKFRQLIGTVATVLTVEATQQLETTEVHGQGPLSQFTAEEIKPRIGIVPILRAGLGMTEAVLELLPENTSVLHIGLFREKVSLQPVEYYNKLPVTPTVEHVLILDPLIATGGTAIACVQMIRDWGLPMENITFLCVLASEQGIKAVTEACPGLKIFVGTIDPHLNDQGLILPGLGDTGDRLFDTIV